MSFDVSKFLALTVLIAGTGAACSSTDNGTEPSKGGSSSGGRSGDGGQSPQGGVADGLGGAAAGSAGVAGEGGATLAGAGGVSLGGTEAGGAGGAGGTPDVGECLASLAEGGAAGAPAVEPSLEGLCMDFFETVCAASPEDFAPSFNVCEGVKERGTPAVAVAVADCIKALSADDQCDGAKVAGCYTALEGRGCANPDGEAACAFIKTKCAEVDVAACRKIADLVSRDMTEALQGCMDPADEGWYDPSFVGTCVARLDNCAGVRL